MSLLHRISLCLTGVYVCGARYADGARAVSANRQVTCPECRRIVRAKQIEAKAKFAKFMNEKDSTNPRLDTTDES